MVLEYLFATSSFDHCLLAWLLYHMIETLIVRLFANPFETLYEHFKLLARTLPRCFGLNIYTARMTLSLLYRHLYQISFYVFLFVCRSVLLFCTNGDRRNRR